MGSNLFLESNIFMHHAAEVKSESEAEGSEVAETKDTEEVTSVSESLGEDTESKQDTEQDEINNESGQSTFMYDQLKAHSDNPVTGIDFKRREVRPIENVLQCTIIYSKVGSHVFVYLHFAGLPVRRGIPDSTWYDKRSILQTTKMEAGHAEEESRFVLETASFIRVRCWLFCAAT